MWLDNHSLLISLREDLGYRLPEDSCHGFAIRWLEACLVGEESLFENRMKEIHSYGDSLLARIQEAQDKEENQLTEEDKKLRDIQAFFDHMELQQSPNDYTSLFGRLFSQSDIESISDIATSDTMRSRGGLCKIYSHPGMYTKEEITQYFDKLGDVVDSATSNSSNECWGILIGGFHHSLAVTYTLGSGWRFMDNEQYPPLAFSKEETHLLADEIMNGLVVDPSIPYIGFNTSIFTVADNKLLPEVTAALNQFDEKQVLTEQILKRESNEYDLACIATQNEHTWVLEEYLKYGLGIDKSYNDYPLIYLAVQHGDLETIEFLSNNGVEINALNTGYTPIYLAATKGDVASISLLAQIGADVNEGHCITLATPVHIAAKNGHCPAISELAKLGADLSSGDDEGTTPLHAAAEENHVAAIMTLIDLKVDPNITDDNEATPLHMAAKRNNIEAIEMLTSLGANPNFGNYNGATPLHMAAKRNNTEAIITLIKLGADPSLIDNNGATPLHIAAQMDNGEAITTLAKLGVDLNCQLDNGATPIFLAAQYGCISALKQLIKAGVNAHSTCEITAENLRDLALHCSEKIATKEYAERIVNNMEQFIKQHHSVSRQTISITPYDMACIVEEEELLCFLDNNHHKRKLDIDLGFFSYNDAKKLKKSLAINMMPSGSHL
ncbi:ankyrin repeat domain-containing protein [Legionella fallonii]|uniref:Uncharacterized protein n=1 Tax=Legionella fallonii LLAP-10 TaxID=1212491 RepID=A0A098G4H2_9GAMM|nr:ankyrin repeat domain-containing protein [Legionella fallonii]CEG56889.1 conserved protein of unknown function [ankyrin repeat] [Legionella fallonii LLAP-10]